MHAHEGQGNPVEKAEGPPPDSDEMPSGISPLASPLQMGNPFRDDLIEIIKRPVAMKSNLHHVIFQPQSLRLSVSDASGKAVACDQPYRTYTWDDLFSAAPPRLRGPLAAAAPWGRVAWRV
jgi:hypothetical protein